MTTSRHPYRDLAPALRVAVGIAVAAALLAGLYGRFKGIGTWPLGVDEFYISRSVDNILRTGVPGFACGGYYTRGLLYQYVVAAIRLLGSPPEFAGRLVAGVCSLLVLPAAYSLGRRVHSSLAGWLSVIILCLSVWEIEMARFARMYAPFQAVFAWYLLCFLHYTVERRKAALGWMVGLSVLGVLLWEGGVLLGFANIFAVLYAHDRGRLRPPHLLRLAGLSVLVVLLFLATRDLRGFAPVPVANTADDGSHGISSFIAASFVPLRQHPLWAALGGAIPLASLGAALPWIWSKREQWVTALGLCAVLAACVLHWFVMAAGFLALLLLARLLDWRDLAGGPARAFRWALASLCIFWLAFDLVSHQAGLGAQHMAGTVLPPPLRFLLGVPDVYDEVLRPWVRTLPFLSAEIVIALAGLAWRAVAARSAATDTDAALLGLLVFIVMVVGAIPTNRIETRYTFFLYPLLIVLSVAALLRLLRAGRAARRVPVALAAVVPLLCFGATEDFQPRHVAAIDTARVNFRVGMSAVLAAHFYPREDVRAVGEWLRMQVRPGDVVITGIPSLDPYYGNFDYFFLADDDGRYEDYLCRDGRTERWTNHPLLYGMGALDSVVQSDRRVFAAVYPDVEGRLSAAASARGWSVERVWSAADGNSDVLLIVRSRPSTAL